MENTNKILRTPDEIRQELALRGISITAWSKQNGFSAGLVHQVLAGRLKCVRGKSHQVAVLLGLKEGLLGDVADLPFGRKGGAPTEEDT